MKHYDQVYRELGRPFRKNPPLLGIFIWFNKHITNLMYVVYPILLLYLVWQREPLLTGILPFVLIPGLTFLGLSAIRKWLKSPRPYEEWNITPLVPKTSRGNSMPSRHVFSATMISMCVLQLQPFLGIFLLCLSVLLAYCRVLVGVHYPKDVLVGLLIGLGAGLLFFLF